MTSRTRWSACAAGTLSLTLSLALPCRGDILVTEITGRYSTIVPADTLDETSYPRGTATQFDLQGGNTDPGPMGERQISSVTCFLLEPVGDHMVRLTGDVPDLPMSFWIYASPSLPLFTFDISSFGTLARLQDLPGETRLGIQIVFDLGLTSDPNAVEGVSLEPLVDAKLIYEITNMDLVSMTDSSNGAVGADVGAAGGAGSLEARWGHLGPVEISFRIVQAVPEPGTLGLSAFGLAALTALAWGRRRAGHSDRVCHRPPRRS